MANLQGKLVQQGQALIYIDANTNFGYMAAALQNDKGIAITVEQSYLSKYDVADSLRLLVKDKTDKPPTEVKPLLDPNKKITDIVNSGDYDKLENYLSNILSAADYEPPLRPDYTSVSGISTKPFPNKVSQDPRRTGHLVKPGPTDVMKSTEVQKWMINNSILYGYVLYDDNGLYYVGFDKIKSRIQGAADKQAELKKVAGSFLKSASLLGLLTTTAQKVIDNKVPNPGTATDPGNLEYVPGSQVKDNNGNIPELIVINNQPIKKDVGIAFLAMQAEAAKVGITLKVSSGFRPAFGANFNGLTSKGRNINFTTQETLRRDKSRWIQSERNKFATDEDFIFKGSSSGYNPATAPPGASQHGSGIAVDMNTGGRTNFSPLNTVNYVWLVKNSYKFGFIRTVKSEEWHYEYLPNLAKNGPYARIAGIDANKFYSDLGLALNQFSI
jgi:LAS superfamily LD-carboxypeptidase LdcB